MEQTKTYSDSNVLKAWAYLSQGHKLITKSGIHVIVDKNNMVLFVLNDIEFQKVFANKSVHYDQATQCTVMLNTPFIQQRKSGLQGDFFKRPDNP